ncbi:hypothetical protein EDF77_3561 [Stenotrophomonas maltophilia]|nr:hypothetical protein [Stenotrophomonas chelatiphaga]ROQ36920.1 hypothetical protein EDF77_3561 [Stenotrophomonas maltophilia]
MTATVCVMTITLCQEGPADTGPIAPIACGTMP